ncbi:MAG TPA: site-specific integrase [Panacibacter sp.]|nr:site-specific integrase [Panacibacter sp.]HNP46058.1 site-specific integrase [Panacibacter sp.]
MASVKIVLRKKQNQDLTYPLAIRITKDRKSSFIYIGHSVKLSDWEPKEQRVKKSHPNSARLNNLILKKLAEANNSLLDLEVQKDSISSHAVKQKIKPSAGSTFFEQAKLYIANLKRSGKFNRVSAEQPRIKHFKEFLKGQDINFQDITVSLLNNFKAYLKGTRSISERTIVNHLIVIRSIFNQAIKGNVTDQKYYPFGSNKIKIKFPDSIKLGLTTDEVKVIEELDLDHTSYLHHARNMWLFSFYFAGMRVSDVLRLKWDDLQDNRLYYAMGKNLKAGSLRIPEKALKIVVQYQSAKDETGLIFPDLKTLQDLDDSYEVQRKIKSVVRRLNENLLTVAKAAKINKPLTMHISRHTFGNISGDKIPIQMLQKLYRHTSVTTTIGYQANFIHKDADEALDSVIAL